MPRLRKSLDDIKYFYKINKGTGCWDGIGSSDEVGYCRIWIEDRTTRLHTMMYEKFYGKLPVGYELHHTCENKRCCNIFHLKPVTPREHKRLHGILLRNRRLRS